MEKFHIKEWKIFKSCRTHSLEEGTGKTREIKGDYRDRDRDVMETHVLRVIFFDQN